MAEDCDCHKNENSLNDTCKDFIHHIQSAKQKYGFTRRFLTIVQLELYDIIYENDGDFQLLEQALNIQEIFTNPQTRNLSVRHKAELIYKKTQQIDSIIQYSNNTNIITID